MDRMKTFGIYALIVILFYIFSNVMINVGLKASYDEIGLNIAQAVGIQIEINEAKATYVNGYVGGKVSNARNEDVKDTYLKIDLYTKRDVCVGTKYVKLDNIAPGKSQDFRMGFRFQDVDYANVSIVNEIGENTSEEEFKSENLDGAMLIAVVVLLCVFG